jgi:hypothetical protein
LARNGHIGEVHTIMIASAGSPPPTPIEVVHEDPPVGFDYDMWLGPAPWKPYSKERVSRTWKFMHDYCLGCLGGAWGIHDIDFSQWANGTDDTGPIEVESEGAVFFSDIRDVAYSWTVEHKYRNGVRLIHMDRPTAQKRAEQFRLGNMATLILGTEGWIWVSRQGMRTEPASLASAVIGANEKRVIHSDDHRRNFLDAIRTGNPTISSIESSVRAEAVCQQGDIAVRLKRKLRWDPENERFLDDDAANRMLSRPMRSAWKV